MSLPFLTQKSRKKYSSKESMGSNSAMQMPHVFVVPPEEDETPAWCFFDAENPALSQVVERPETPEISGLAFQSDMNSPAYHDHLDNMDATTVPGDNMSVVDALMADGGQGDEYIDSDMESDYGDGGDEELEDGSHPIRESARYLPRDVRNAADDSDVIEVVKVSRRSVVPESFDNGESTKTRSEMKRTTTLKSRASKVFRSLKGTLRSKPRAQDIFPPPPLPISTTSTTSPLQQPEVSDRPKTPTVKRRGSRTLSQLFTAPSLKSQTSVASFDDRAPISPTDSASVTSHPQSFSGSTKPLSRRSSIYSAAAQDEARLKAASPTPTTSSSKSATRRFSMLTLQKLFSHSSAPAPTPTPIIPEESGRTTPTPRSTTSTPPSIMSSDLTSGPQTPTSSEEVNSVRLVSRKDTADPPAFDSFESVFDTNGGLNLGLGLGLNLNSEFNPNLEKTPQKRRSNSLRQSWEAVTPRLFSKGPPPRPSQDTIEEGDVSFEMRLDSLHFDSLSFDADQFIAK